MLVVYESINDECFSSHFLHDEAVWSAGKCPSCVTMTDQHQIITVTNLEGMLSQGHWMKRGHEREEEETKLHQFFTGKKKTDQGTSKRNIKQNE